MERFYVIHNTPIFLGRQGENNAREVVFDIGGWLETYGEGAVQLFARRSGESVVYPVPFRWEGQSIVWTVTEADVAIVGQTGECELSYQPDDDTLVKSETWATFVLPALEGNVGEAPDAARAWIDALRRETASQQKLVKEASRMATEAAQSAGIAGGRAQAAQGYMLSAQEAAMAAGLSASGANAAAQEAQFSAERAEAAAERAENAGGGGGGGGGEPGKDGVSPTVDVTAITGGHRVTITDVNDTETFDVLDGETGERGPTGADGVGIESVEQTTTSYADGGSNVITMTMTDGGKATFSVRNGSKGSQGNPGANGSPGAAGKDATINGVNALTLEGGKYIHAEQDGTVLRLEVTSGIAVHRKTLTVEGWGGYNSYYKTYEQTVTVDGVTTHPRQAVFKDVELDVYDYDGNNVILAAWNGANGGGPNNCPVEQLEGALKFYCTDKPTVNIPMVIAVATPPVATGAVFEFSVYHTYKNDYEGETVTYQAREGMTWAEWCASEYNPGEFEDNGYGNIYDAGYNCVYYDLEDWEVADRNDVIEARQYVAESDGS